MCVCALVIFVLFANVDPIAESSAMAAGAAQGVERYGSVIRVVEL